MTSELKIGKVARFVLRPLLESGKIPEDEIENLQDESYCKETFGLFVPMLRLYEKKDAYRYYSPRTTLLSIYEKKYLLTNDWYEDKDRHLLKPLLNWIAKYNS